MKIKDINFAINVLSHPQDGDESDINMALDIAIKVLKAYRDGLTESENIMTNKQINKIKKEYFVMDEYGYTDKELVDTVNIIVDKVNELTALMQQRKVR